MKLYHYTVGMKVPLITADGFIATSPKQAEPPERPCVWLSTNARYEHTARKAGFVPGRTPVVMTKRQTAEIGGGLVRYCFELDQIKALPWSVLKDKLRMKSRLRRQLLDRAKEIGAKPSDWWGSLSPLPIAGVPVEIQCDGEWVPYDESIATALASNQKVLMGTADEVGIGVSDDMWRDSATRSKPG